MKKERVHIKLTKPTKEERNREEMGWEMEFLFQYFNLSPL